MHNPTRRDMLKGAAAVAAAAVSPLIFGSAAGAAGEVKMEYVTLNNGVRMPVLGYGTLRLPQESCAECVSRAIRTGWRLIDTAKNYVNETQVGEGIRRSGIDRKELFVTSKLWFKDYSYDRAKAAFQESLDRLQLDYLDLCLLHQPFGDVHGGWRALEELHEAGKIRAIGVSNFFPDRLTDLVHSARIRPAVNQIEFSPYFQRWEDRKTNERWGVAVESWGPLCSGSRPGLLKEPALVRIAEKHGRTPAQVILRWLTQQQVITVCKTQRPERMVENLQIFDFRLDEEDLAAMASLDTGRTTSKNHRSPDDVVWFHTQATRTPK